jgi:D-alanyl-lipoteichoic acid acyltransferase DltB (MBOAT superfamily)
MVFNSYTFIVFLLVTLLFCRANTSWVSKKAFLLIGSYIFYAAWNPPFVALIWLSTVVDWYLARGIAQTASAARKKLLVVASLVVNLGLLGFFKYGNFALENFIAIAASAGIQYQPAALDIILPVGISFYTFQTLSYTLDVYRGHLKPADSFLNYALFVTFFPQLVAGPIVRASEFLPQTEQPTRATRDQLTWGFGLIILGLFQKVAIADGLLAPVVEAVYDSALSPSPIAAGIATLAFAGQIFCDFAGYSTIAIGCALCLGFSLPDNFRFPYAAIGFSDFWRRWHISLSSWLRDYLYISLGGNRYGRLKRYRNLMLTMLLGGLWHGASWNFVIWGFLHGLYLVLEQLGIFLFGGWAIWRRWIARLALGATTFGLVCFAWIFFRAQTLERAVDIIKGMALIGPRELYVPDRDVFIVGAVMGALLLFHALLRNMTLEEGVRRVPPLLRVVVLSLMLAAVAMSPGEDRAFIYFQF